MRFTNIIPALLSAVLSFSVMANVLISEFTYDAQEPYASGDWVEICNYGTEPVDVSGWQLGDDKYDKADRVLFTIPQGTTLAPKECLVLYTAAEFTSVYPSVTNALGPTTIGFGKSEDEVVILNAQGQVMHKISYLTESSGGVWPAGTAFPNVLKFPCSKLNDAWQTWGVSTVKGGTPGVFNPETLYMTIDKHSRNPNSPTSTTTPRISIIAYDESTEDRNVHSATLYYSTTENGTYTPVEMTMAEAGEWFCTLPAMEEGTTVFYYPTVSDAKGNTLARYWNVLNAPYMYIVTNNPVYDGIVINEIMYQCLDIAYTNAKGSCKNYEFVELFNRTATTIDLSYWRYECDDNKYRLPKGTSLEAGGFLVITDKPEALSAVYALPPHGQILGFDISLSNGGDDIFILNANGQEVDSVVYSSSAPWPVDAAGKGPSLELKDPYSDNSLPSNWQASYATYGTPCEPNSVPEPSFLLAVFAALAAVCLRK